MKSYVVTAQKQALASAFDNVLKTQAEEREAERQAARARRRAAKRPRLLLLVAIFLMTTATGWTWYTRPDWIFRPTSIPESSAVKEASLRIMMANAAQHVERYRTRHGKLPGTLRDAGVHGTLMSYVVDGTDAYHLIGSSGPVSLTLRSSQSLPSFIGNSFTVVASRRMP